MSARAEILHRIRTAGAIAPQGFSIPREYLGPQGPGSIELFTRRLEDYHATVRRVPRSHVATTLAEIFAVRGIQEVLVPTGFSDDFLLEVTDSVRRDEPPLSYLALDEIPAVVTTCTWAVAESGTIILTHGPGEGRRAVSLIPDVHVVVVAASQILQGVPDAIRLTSNAPVMTWISGPSATSDIELDRVEGVHGPRIFEVLVIEDL